MTGPASRILNSIGTYWAPIGSDGFGQPLLAAPVLVNCRWIHETQMVRNMQGDTVNTHHVVYLDVDVDEEGYITLGDYSHLTDPRIPGSLVPPEYGQVKAFFSSADLRNLERERRAHLI